MDGCSSNQVRRHFPEGKPYTRYLIPDTYVSCDCAVGTKLWNLPLCSMQLSEGMIRRRGRGRVEVVYGCGLPGEGVPSFVQLGLQMVLCNPRLTKRALPILNSHMFSGYVLALKNPAKCSVFHREFEYIEVASTFFRRPLRGERPPAVLWLLRAGGLSCPLVRDRKEVFVSRCHQPVFQVGQGLEPAIVLQFRTKAGFCARILGF